MVIFIGIIIAITIFVRQNVLPLIEKFEKMSISNKKDLVIQEKYLLAFNLKTKQNDTIVLNGLTTVNYWAYYCSPCIAEMSMFNEISKRKDNRVLLFTRDSSDQTFKFLEKNKIDPNVYYYLDTSIFGKTEVIPRTIIIKDSVIKFDFTSQIQMDIIGFNKLLDSLQRD